jgi:ABC-type Na+ efflux pump permease subunit
VSVLVPNADSAGPIVSLVFFIVIAFSGLYFPVQPGSAVATVTNIFPIRHLILATVDTFNGIPGTSVWNDILVMLVWGAAGVWVGLRRWDWSPKRG